MKNEKTIGITGASGTLGRELTKLFRQGGYKVIGFTHSKTDSEVNLESPNKWIKWECGKESKLKKTFSVNLIIYLLISVIALLLLESLGLFYVKNYPKKFSNC